ncbi:MAG: ABC transporter substrate-binding protein [Comamonas sp.]
MTLNTLRTPAPGQPARPSSRRRQLLAAGIGAATLGLPAAVWAAGAAAPAPIVSDAHVQWIGPALKAPARRIVLAQGRMLPALGMVDPAIAGKLVGWANDLSTMYAAENAAWVAKFPDLAKLPVVGRGRPETLSVEQVLALDPDLVIYSRQVAGSPSSYGRSTTFQTLTKAGIPVLVVDFFTQPLANTRPSLLALAQVLGTTAHVQPFLDDYSGRLDRVRQRIAQARPKTPQVFVHAHAGSAECCFSPGKGTFDDFVSHAGGHNLGADLLTAPTGQIAREMVLRLQPDVYLATGTDTLHGTGKFLIGPNIAAPAAASGLREVIKLSQLDTLEAVARGNAHGFWHGFNDTPAHVVLVEALAQWLHPKLFADLDPAATLRDINARFFQVPLQGTFWTDLPAAGAAPGART